MSGILNPRLAVFATSAIAVLAASAPAQAAEPHYLAGNPSCADIDPTWSEYKIEPPVIGFTAFDNGEIAGVIGVDLLKRYFAFKVEPGIDAVIVKGGDNANLYEYEPDAMSDSGLHAPINPNTDMPYGLSHISFCYGPDEPNDGGDTPDGGGGGETPTGGGDTPTGGGDAPTGDTPDPKQDDTPTGDPRPEVLGDSTESGFASMQGRSGCVGRAFTARIRGRAMRKVEFRLDGKRVKTTRFASGKGRRASLRIHPRRHSMGVHRLTARVTFARSSETPARTLRLTFQRCARQAVLPTFTG